MTFYAKFSSGNNPKSTKQPTFLYPETWRESMPSQLNVCLPTWFDWPTTASGGDVISMNLVMLFLLSTDKSRRTIAPKVGNNSTTLPTFPRKQKTKQNTWRISCGLRRYGRQTELFRQQYTVSKASNRSIFLDGCMFGCLPTFGVLGANLQMTCPELWRFGMTDKPTIWLTDTLSSLVDRQTDSLPDGYLPRLCTSSKTVRTWWNVVPVSSVVELHAYFDVSV